MNLLKKTLAAALCIGLVQLSAAPAASAVERGWNGPVGVYVPLSVGTQALPMPTLPETMPPSSAPSGRQPAVPALNGL